MTNKNYNGYKDLDVWKESRDLVSEIYCLTKTFPREERYGLTSKMRRCAISVPSNIAEGCGRQHYKDSINFFHMSKGSLFKLETLLCLSFDVQYIEEDLLDKILDMITIILKMLRSLIDYYESCIEKDKKIKEMNIKK